MNDTLRSVWDFWSQMIHFSNQYFNGEQAEPHMRQSTGNWVNKMRTSTALLRIFVWFFFFAYTEVRCDALWWLTEVIPTTSTENYFKNNGISHTSRQAAHASLHRVASHRVNWKQTHRAQVNIELSELRFFLHFVHNLLCKRSQIRWLISFRCFNATILCLLQENFMTHFIFHRIKVITHTLLFPHQLHWTQRADDRARLINTSLLPSKEQHWQRGAEWISDRSLFIFFFVRLLLLWQLIEWMNDGIDWRSHIIIGHTANINGSRDSVVNRTIFSPHFLRGFFLLPNVWMLFCDFI